MEWSACYDEFTQPGWENIASFIDSNLWPEINRFLQETYDVAPQLAYSKCPMQKGWNVKYKKGGKSLCTIYPMPGYFIALVVIGDKETPECEYKLPLLGDYTQNLFRRTPVSAGGRWLMLSVTDKDILNDVGNLIQIRVKPKAN